VSESKGGREPVSHHPPHLAVAGARGRLQPLLSFSPQPTSPPASKQARKSTRHGTARRTWRSEQEARRAGNHNAIGREEEDGRRSCAVRTEEDPRRDPGRDTCAGAPFEEKVTRSGAEETPGKSRVSLLC
jgi:hypothetical protein